MRYAWRVSVRKSRVCRCCWRQVSTMARSVSTKRLPESLWVPNESLRQMSAWRSDCSARLLVGSTPGRWAKIQSCSNRSNRLWHSVTVGA